MLSDKVILSPEINGTMTIRARWLRFSFILLVVAAISLLFGGCPDPFSVEDDAIRDLDRPLASDTTVEEPAADPYDTLPTWTWTGDPVEGTGVFRYRLNGGEWIVEVGVTSFTPDTDLYPGTYLFEVQERNAAGNWSDASSSTVTILVREPEFTGGPGFPSLGTPTNTTTPGFTWQQWRDTDTGEAQFGATGSFSYSLERRSGGEWVEVSSESAVDQQDLSGYTIAEPLADGLYRFGVAELNMGGRRSAYELYPFEVDTVPPNPPIHTTAERIVASPTPTWTWTTGGPDGNGTYRGWLRSDGSVPDPETDVTALDFGPAATASYMPDAQLGEGSHLLYVQERDAAGNWSGFGVFEITYDPNIPSFLLSGEVTGPANDPPHPDYVYDSNDIQIEFISSGTDAVDTMSGPTFQYSIDGGLSWSADVIGPQGAQIITLPGDGMYEIRVRQLRTDSSYTPASTPATVVVDTIPPGTPVVSGPGFDGTPVFTFLSEITINVNDPDGDGTVVFDVRRNGALALEGAMAGPVHVQLNTIGTYSVTVTGRDLAENQSVVPAESALITVLDPASAPVVSGEEVTLQRRPTWTWSSLEDLEGNLFRYRLDGGAWVETGAGHYTPGFDLTTGLHELEVEQRDDLGTWSSPGSFITEVLGTGDVEMTILLQNPANPTFTLPSPEQVNRGDTITVNLESTIAFDEVIWIVNGIEVVGDGIAAPATEASLTLIGDFTSDPNLMPLGINRITVLVEIDGNWYSSEDMTFEVVEP
jgi:hypothetical protein